MKSSALKNISLLGIITLLLVPACLGIYQYFQFGKITFDLHMMSPEAILRTVFSAILASAFLFVILRGLPLIQRFQAN